MTRAIAIVLCVLAACTSFETLERGVCGNGLVEPGEDCDSGDPSCVRCAVVCAADADCPTTAYACGTDGLCHAPGGALASPVPAGAFQVDEVAITDIDRDGVGDAVGVSSTSIAIRYGDPAARLTRAESVLTPPHAGPPAFGDLDGDGALDIAISAPDGLVAYGSRFGELAPLAVRSAVVDAASGTAIDLREVFQLATFTLGAFAVDTANGGIVGLLVIDFLGTTVFDAPCRARLGGLTADEIDAATLDIYKLGDSDTVVSFLAGTPAKACVLALHKPAFASWTITDITPANSAALARRPVLADLDTDSDRCPSLVNTDGGAPALRVWDGAMTGAGCTLAQVASPTGTPLPPAGQATGTIAVGRIPMVPAFVGLASDLLVMSDGVYAYQPGAGFGRLYTSERRLAGADFADLDGDGAIDGVLRAETEDDIDVLFRRPSAYLPALPGYVVYRVDTASRVVATKIGDYDGNGRRDLAIVEQLADYQRLVVAYGRADFLAPPVGVAAFAAVHSLAAIPFAGTEDQAGITDDLVVLQPPAPGRTTSSITLLLGSTLGTMIPFFDPRSDDDPGGGAPSDRDRTVLAAVVSGRFGAVAQAGVRDLLAIGVDARDVPSSLPMLWRLPGTDAGPDATEHPPTDTSGLADCATGIGTGLCVRDARFLAWPGADADSVIAVDRARPPHAVRFDPAAAAPVAATSLGPVVAALGTAVVRSLAAADLDGDGAPELVVAAAPPDAGSRGAVLACAMAGGDATACEDVVPAITGAAEAQGAPITACVDAAPIRATFHDRATAPSAARDLVVACRDAAGSALYRVHGRASGEVTLLARTPGKLARVAAGDVTGDGVDDVLAIEGDDGAQSLVVFPQCSSRDALACPGGGS